MRPAEAAFRVIAEALQENKEAAGSIANSLPNSITAFLRKKGSKHKMNLEDVATMRANWVQLFRGELPSSVSLTATQDELARQVALPKKDPARITRDQRLKARELYAIESRINAIESLLTEVDVSNDKKGGNDKGDGKDDEGIIQKFIDSFSKKNQAPGTSANRSGRSPGQ